MEPIAIHLLRSIRSSRWARAVHLSSIIEILGSTLEVRSVGRECWLKIWILRPTRNSPKIVLGIGSGQTLFQHPIVVTYNRRELGMEIQ